MLKNEVREVREKKPYAVIESIAPCKFCGQAVTIQILESWENDQEQQIELATETCDCYEAERYTRKKTQQERAENKIKQLFDNEDEEIQIPEIDIEILHKAVAAMLKDELTSIVLDLGEGLKAKISQNKDGVIKVERTKTEKSALDA